MAGKRESSHPIGNTWTKVGRLPFPCIPLLDYGVSYSKSSGLFSVQQVDPGDPTRFAFPGNGRASSEQRCGANDGAGWSVRS